MSGPGFTQPQVAFDTRQVDRNRRARHAFHRKLQFRARFDPLERHHAEALDPKRRLWRRRRCRGRDGGRDRGRIHGLGQGERFIADPVAAPQRGTDLGRSCDPVGALEGVAADIDAGGGLAQGHHIAHAADAHAGLNLGRPDQPEAQARARIEAGVGVCIERADLRRGWLGNCGSRDCDQRHGCRKQQHGGSDVIAKLFVHDDPRRWNDEQFNVWPPRGADFPSAKSVAKRITCKSLTSAGLGHISHRASFMSAKTSMRPAARSQELGRPSRPRHRRRPSRLRRARSGRGSSPCSTRPRNPARTSCLRRH